MVAAIDDDVIAQLEAWQAPEEVIEAARAKLAPVDLDFYVWEENWPTLVLFLDVSTQWNVQVSMAGLMYFGLDYRAVQSTMDMQLIQSELRPGLFEGLRLMERAALPLLNERMKR